MMLVQKLATDNRRLREAKRRAAQLMKQSQSLPENSARRRAFTQAAVMVDFRVLMAAMVPVGLLLGLLVALFAWFKDRMDPSVPVGLAGSPVQIVAIVKSDWTRPVQILVPTPLIVDETTPASRVLPPIRETLEHLLALYRQSQTQTNLPWELQTVPNSNREQAAKDLQNYLAAGVPPQGITWMIRPPADITGRFAVSVVVDGHTPLTVNIVMGRDFPPAKLTAAGGPDSPVRELRVVYPPAGQKPFFWKPLAGIAGHNVPLAEKLSVMDVGWLLLYILAYLPALFLSKAALKVA